MNKRNIYNEVHQSNGCDMLLQWKSLQLLSKDYTDTEYMKHSILTIPHIIIHRLCRHSKSSKQHFSQVRHYDYIYTLSHP